MIDVKQAVKIAFEYLSSLYEQDELHDLLLEEVELSDDELYWFVTLGFTQNLSVPPGPYRHVDVLTIPRYSTRVYKVIEIDANTGQALSMKIRKA